MFYFRLLIPRDLQACIQRSEFRFSLNTERRQEAIILALPLIAEIPELIANLRNMADKDDGELRSTYMKQWLKEKRQNVSLKMRIEELEAQLDEAQRQLRQSVESKVAVRYVKNAYTVGQLKGKRELEERLVFPWPPEKTALFSKLQAAYLKSLSVRPEGARKKPPTEKTLDDYDKNIAFFIKVMGDMNIGYIDREIAGEYFSLLRKLPANLSRVNQFKGKTITELLAMKALPQSETNCSKKVERIATMFKWALEEKRKWGIDTNPFTGFAQADSHESKRRPFTMDELRILLNHEDFKNRQFFSAYRFWLIPLATFTGARLGELAQLDIKDFTEVDGIPCIDINDIDAVEIKEDEGGRKKRVKTKNAKRLVPIHRELIRIGILRHIGRLREEGEQHLFPELSRTRRDGPAHAASNWFQEFRKDVGINAKQETVFHSFRHLFITRILDAGVSPHMLAPIVGHEAELITSKVYWNKRDAAKRQPTVEAFALPDEITELFPTLEQVTFSKARRKK
jgi:integrase